MPDFILPVLFLPLFVAFWCAVCSLIGAIGGWRALAEHYAANAGEFQGQRWHMRSGRMRGRTRYNGVLTVGADMRGLYLATLFLLRPGHRPLFIPWNAIQIREGQSYFARHVELAFTAVPGVYLALPHTFGMEVVRAGGRTIATS